ncbi:hypothetical protein KsCSTR_49460 [Candidatus Kuenenia stuttgartiensis]|uniref:Uncharacterized protein n=1 Tax=Kuenenia stuttgartiensis TaxID=174633 RepID=A0A6G7GYC8_KUEST|nr:hypothetical protein KsCSTR_49460 [Candidatus Kuenenia stuttgartiensis]
MFERIYDNLRQMLRPYTAIIGIFQKTKVLLLFMSRTKIYFTKGKKQH